MSVYKLSATLNGHDSDVKGVTVPPGELNTFLSVSRDSTTRVWTNTPTDQSPHWTNSIIHHGQGYINCVCTMTSPDGKLYGLSAGQDKTVTINALDSLDSLDSGVVLVGHQSNICSIDANYGIIITGSWDTTAKVWIGTDCKYTLTAHSQSVWAVKILSEHEFLTGGADKAIHLWRDNQIVKSFIGHTDAVRAFCILNETTFASCSNDGTIRIWDITSGQCTTVLEGHDNFIYSIVVLPSGEIVSSAEDRTVRIWNWHKLQCLQVIVLPSISIWCVDANQNGDIFVGCSDTTVRVFSRDPSRWASEQDLKYFEDCVSSSSINKSTINNLDEKDIKGPEILLQRGTKEGQIVIVRQSSGILEAHQWANNTWTKVGDVVDAVGNQQRQSFEGKEYDYVFDVNIQDDAPALKLPFNAGENPYTAAQRFIDQHELSQNYVDEVARFLIQNSQAVNLTSDSAGEDPYGSRYVPGSSTNPGVNFSAAPASPATTSVPSSSTKSALTHKNIILPQRTYLSFESYNTASLVKGVLTLNARQSTSLQFSLEDLETIKTLLEKPVLGIDEAQALLPFIIRICNGWETKTPGYDMLRIIITKLPSSRINEEAVPLILASIMSEDGQTKLQSEQADAITAVKLMGYRSCSNLFLNHTDIVKELKPILIESLAVLSSSSSLSSSNAKFSKLLSLAGMTLLLNFAVYANKEKDNDLGLVLFDDLLSFGENNNSSKDSELAYRTLITLGTLVDLIGASQKQKIVETLNAMKRNFGSEERFVIVFKEIYNYLL
ncbi:PFU-domain-containing protein [Nadsonia fulvescens var. elongata DSM 6958]|uniref:PFU-domain-containing protein n=1 Tax=Nadsonia fulvescens var. elongata DSM 6958 TaxID=857566 RepID=A0A1E3PGH5_9ASCO|nr:PFU-domain-containing protein [Nadsonia fulvescens var. elongata DSM 6958]